MKRPIAWALCWTLYGCGDLLSRFMNRFDAEDFTEENFVDNLYRRYNWLMCASLTVQDWGGVENGPWEAK